MTNEEPAAKPQRITKKAQREQEKRDAIARLRELAPQGSTLYTVLRHESRSGMSRNIDVFVFAPADDGGRDGDPGRPVKLWLTYLAHTALGWPLAKGDQGVKVSGCGMDMGFHLVETLSRVVYGESYAWRQEWI